MTVRQRRTNPIQFTMTAHQMNIDLIVFDLGRVLIRICDNWRHACEVARVPSRVKELAPDEKAKLRELVVLAETGRMDLDEFARRAAPLLGASVSCVLAMSNAYLIGPFPGVDALLDDLAVANVKTACLSNTNPSHWDMMCAPSGPAALPMHKLTWQFGSHAIGVRKPDERIYRHVETTTRTPAEKIAFFDDIEENVIAARGRGWHATRIGPQSDPIEQVRRALRDLNVL